MREKLVKSIRSVTGQINLDEGRRERLTPEQLGVREERKAYKQALGGNKDSEKGEAGNAEAFSFITPPKNF